ncbi:MAG TPA: hypothetical protein VFQ63_03290 [Patescibacteria group bacterium]|nr:hypothetical protein [Patescibacteria group bacterium]
MTPDRPRETTEGDTFRQAVRREVGRLAGSVGDSSDLATYTTLEEQAEQLPVGDKQRKRLERRMRRLGPPTETQVFLKRALGLGIIGAVAIFTVISGEQTITHLLQSHAALTDIQTALHHFNIFNAGDTAQRVMTDINTAETNASEALVDGAKTMAGGIVETGAIALKPWTRPKRRGIVI